MKIAQLIGEDLIVPTLSARNQIEVLDELGTCLAARHEGMSEEEVVRALAERERLGSTAVAEGLAVPHAKLAAVAAPVSCFGRSRRGIDFGSPDGKPTHFFFALIAPASAPGTHLKTLARVSRLFRSSELRSRLMAAATAREIYEALAAEELE